MKRILFVMLVLAGTAGLNAQENLLDLLADHDTEGIERVTATFKTTRIMNGHSIERTPAGQFDFRISHRFGRVDAGFSEFFGLDQATMHLGMEYGVTDWLMIGLGRSSWEKTFDGFLKFSLLRQSTGQKSIPVSVSLFSSLAMRTGNLPQPPGSSWFASRLATVNQLLVGRKFSEAFSLQLTPTWLHRNLVDYGSDPNDILALGAGGRIKLAKRISFNAEYFLIAANQTYRNEEVFGPLTIGFDIETGGHVFQLLFSNSRSMIEKGFIGETTGRWSNGDVYFGFNLLRVFTIR